VSTLPAAKIETAERSEIKINRAANEKIFEFAIVLPFNLKLCLIYFLTIQNICGKNP